MRIAAIVSVLTMLVLAFGVPGLTQPASDTFLITPGVGVGGVKVGMHVADVVAILGTPKVTKGVSGGGARYSWYEVINRAGPGVEAGSGLSVLTNAQGTVIQVQVYYDDRYATADGFHTGMTEAQVRGRLGEPSKVIPVGNGYSLSYLSRGIAFHVVTNPQIQGYKTVVWISIFAAVGALRNKPRPSL